MKTEKFARVNPKPLKVGIIGSGTMGLQLTKLFLKKDCNTVVVSRDIDRARDRLNGFFLENSDNIVKNLVLTDSMSELEDCDFIFECVVENIQVKKEVFRQVLAISHGVVASCTSSFTLEDISKDLKSKGRLNVLHFSNPVSAMKVVEVVYSPETSLVNRNLIEELLAKIEYVGIEVPDIPGFVINSLLFPLIFNAIQIHYKYGLTQSNIDLLMKKGCGFPMGPFEIIDLVGVDTVISVLRNLGYDFSDKVLKTLIARN